MPRSRWPHIVLVLGLVAGGASAQEPAPSDAAKAMVGAWEISNAARDKTCPVTLRPRCRRRRLQARARSRLRHRISAAEGSSWSGPSARTIRCGCSTARAPSSSTSPKSRPACTKPSARARGCSSCAPQAAIKAATVSRRAAVRRMDAAAGIREAAVQAHARRMRRRAADTYHITVKPGCAAPIAEFRPDDLAARGQRAAARRPRRHLALLGKRRHHLGAHPAQHRSAAADAAAIGGCYFGTDGGRGLSGGDGGFGR